MQNHTISIAEGKKAFSRLIKDVADHKGDVVVTRRGKPVAVVIPHDKYRKLARGEAYRKIVAARERFSRSKLKASDIYEESRRELEDRS